MNKEITGNNIIINFGGGQVLEQLGFVYGNNHWGIKKTYHKRVFDKYGNLENGGCIGELMLTTYLYGFIGVSFYIYDNRYDGNGFQRIFDKLQVRTLEELKEIVNIFNEYSTC